MQADRPNKRTTPIRGHRWWQRQIAPEVGKHNDAPDKQDVKIRLSIQIDNYIDTDLESEEPTSLSTEVGGTYFQMEWPQNVSNLLPERSHDKIIHPKREMSHNSRQTLYRQSKMPSLILQPVISKFEDEQKCNEGEGAEPGIANLYKENAKAPQEVKSNFS